MTSILPALTFRRSRAIRSNASKLRGVTAAPCSMAITPLAALSTSSPRTAQEARHFQFARKPAWGRSISTRDRSRPHQTRVPGQRPSSETASTLTDIGRITRSRNKMVSARSATPRLTSLRFSTSPATINNSDCQAAGRSIRPPASTNSPPTVLAPIAPSTMPTSRASTPPPDLPRRCGTAANSSSMAAYATKGSRPISSTASATSIPDCKPGR
ncbi:hypothetical protein GALL_441160 [mine drainage metagenome]|uniref:Uncharacterized protein n=1 Tax=mine drainage metagenome TaxID=410659 RepID=A0A1J5PRK5_9ZZZZ